MTVHAEIVISSDGLCFIYIFFRLGERCEKSANANYPHGSPGSLIRYSLLHPESEEEDWLQSGI